MEEKVMSRLKQAVKMLRYNFSSIAFFEVVYRVLSLAILTPAMYGLLNVSMFRICHPEQSIGICVRRLPMLYFCSF